jgi:hypothetical protein
VDKSEEVSSQVVNKTFSRRRVGLFMYSLEFGGGLRFILSGQLDGSMVILNIVQ